VTTGHLDAPADLQVENPCRMTWLDIATSSMVGREPGRKLRRPPRATSPAAALEDVLEPVLAEGRCLVSFSGGAESSLVLAAATRAARRHGHRDPVPITTRYVRAASARDIEGQEQMIAHLELRDWERVVIDDELELTGPYARRALDEAGILFPSNAYLLLPQLDAAAGGSLVVAFGLTDFFMYWHWARVWDIARLRRSPGRTDLRYLAAAALPRGLRGPALARRLRRARMSWLRPDAASVAERRFLAEGLAVPIRFSAALGRQYTHRCLGGTRRALGALAETARAHTLMPLHNERYVGATAAQGRWSGIGSRRLALNALAGDLVLPGEIVRRPDAPLPHNVLFGERTREFVRSWSGKGLDLDVVDPDELHAHWSQDTIDWRSSLLLQLAFAHDAGVGIKSEEPRQSEYEVP
jgi:asparagine synthase (glutamine-hydrolysing)